MELEFTLDGLQEAVRTFWEKYGRQRVFAFQGPMGAGKTSFIHALCDYLQVSSPVSSPTFSIINEYLSPSGNIYHIDLYRLKDEDDAIRAGVEDCLYSGVICFVEWPGIAPGIFPDDAVWIHIEISDPQKRKIHTEVTV